MKSEDTPRKNKDESNNLAYTLKKIDEHQRAS